jgi:hypothetical protein
LYVSTNTTHFFGSYNTTSSYTYSTTPSIFDEPIMASWSVTTAGSQPTVDVLKTQTGTQRQVATYSAATGQGLPIDGFGSNMIGDYAEIIYYDGTKTAADKIKIESYLAAKYGFTYHDAADAPADMVASDGTLMRDVSAAGVHTTRSFVIGQDDVSGLLNVSATTNDTDDQILSVSGASDQNNLEFVSFADNNKQKTTSVEEGLDVGGTVLRLSRSWIYQTFDGDGTDGAGTVDLVFDLNKQSALDAAGTLTSDYSLIIDADGDFTTGASLITPTTVAAGIVTFAGVTLTDGNWVSIVEPGPVITYPFTEPLETVEFGEDETLNDGTIRTDANIADTPMTLTLVDDIWTTGVADAALMTITTHYTVTPDPTTLGFTAFNVRKVNSTTVDLELTGSATAHANADDTSFVLAFTAAAFDATEVASYVLNSTKTIGINYIGPNNIDVELSSSTASTPGTGFPAGEDSGAAAGLFPELLVEGTIIADQTVDLAVTGGTATGAGADFTYGGATNVVTVTIPAGAYDGTTGTAIDLGDPTLTQDIAIEGNETIELTLQNASNSGVIVFIDDVDTGDGDAVTQSTFTFTITDDDTSGIAGVVYAANRSTTLAGRVVRLLVNGADPASGAIYDETDASGIYEIDPIIVNTYDKDQVLTLFLDDETENGATVVIGGTDDADILSVDIYQDHIRIMDDGSTTGIVTNALLATAAGGDTNTSGVTSAPAGSTTDLSDLFSVAGSDLDVAGGIEIATGDTYAPGGNIALEGGFINLGTYTTAAETVTFDGASNQMITSNGSSFNNIVNDAGADAAVAAVKSTLTLGDALTVGGSYTNEDGETVSLGGHSFTVTGTFTNGTTVGNEGANLNLFGSETVTLTNDLDSGTWTYIGDGPANPSNRTIRETGAVDYYNLTINDTNGTNSDTFNLGAALAIANDLTVTDGDMDTDDGYALDVEGDLSIGVNGKLRARSSAVTVATNWSNAGTFTADGSTVTLDGDDVAQNVLGATTFFNFTISEDDDGAATHIVGFEESQTQVVGGAFNAAGNTGDLVSLVSVTPLEAASTTVHTINVTGTLGTLEYLNIEYSDLQETGVTKSPALGAPNSIETVGITTSGWFLANAISGIVYEPDGVTPITSMTVRLLVNGVDSGLTADTNVSGYYEITGFTYTAGQVLTVYLDDETENGATVTVAAGVSDAPVGGLDIIENVLRATHESAGPVTIANLDTGNPGTDPGTSTDDLAVLYADVTTLNTTATTTLMVPAGDTFAPGANITLGGNLDLDGTMTATTEVFDFGGNVDIDAAGTFTAPSVTMTMAGNWVNAGTFTHNSGTVDFDGAAAQTVTSGGSSFFDVENSNVAAAAVSQIDTFTAAGTFTNDDDATWILAGNDFTVTGAFTNGIAVPAIVNDASIQMIGAETVTLTTGPDVDSGTFEYVGNGTGSSLLTQIADFGASDYFNLTINDADAVGMDLFQLGAALTVDGTLTVANGKFDANDLAMDLGGFSYSAPDVADFVEFTTSTATVSGDWNVTTAVTAQFDAGTSTVSFDGPTAVQQSINGTTTFYNLSLVDDAAGGRTIGFEEDVVQTLNGTFTADTSAGNVITIRTIDVTKTELNDASQSTINNVNALYGVIDYLDVRDSILQDGGVAKSPELDPANSTNSTNNFGWFAASGPGGVSTNLQLWLSADSGVYTDAGVTLSTDTQGVQQWNDKANSNNFIETTNIEKPIFTENSSNFNPTLTFDGVDDNLDLSGGLTAFNGANAFTLFSISKTSVGGKSILGPQGAQNGMKWTMYGGGNLSMDHANVTSVLTGTESISDNIPSLAVFTRDGSGNNEIIIDAKVDASNPTVASFDASVPLSIGSTNTIEVFDGGISEIIVYDAQLADLDQQKVNTYLGLKYGITLSSDNDGDTTLGEVISGLITEGDYVLSDGSTVVWDYSASTAYHNNIAGIARDNTGGLNQIASKSVNSEAIVTITNGTDPATPAAFASTGQALVWGDDGVATAWVTDSDGNNLDDAPNGFQVLDRVWKVQETGAVGVVSIEVDVDDADFDMPALINGTAYYLIVDTDTDGDFSDETPVAMADDGMALGDQTTTNAIWTVNTTDFDTGEYFTFATVVVSETISGTVYTDQGATFYGVADTVNVFVNGVSDGTGLINAVDGTYTVVLSALPSADDIITVYVDGGTASFVAAAVTRHDGATIAVTGMDLYQDHLITRTETANALTSANLDTAHDGVDADLTALWADGATTTVAAGKTLYVWAGDSFAPGAAVDANGAIYVAAGGTYDMSITATNVAGDFTNAGTLTCVHATAPDLTFDGGVAQNFTPNTAQIHCDILVDIASTEVVLQGALDNHTHGITTNLATNVLDLNGNNVTGTGALTNNGTVRLQGIETFAMAQDDNSGTWEYVGNGTASLLETTIKDFGATDYFNLTINDTSASKSDTFKLGAGMKIDGDLNVTDSTFDTADQAVDIDGSVIIGAAGTLRARTSAITIGTDWTNAGTFTVDTSTITFDANATPAYNHALSGATTFYNLTVVENATLAGDTVLTMVDGETMTIGAGGMLTLNGLDASNTVNLVSSPGAANAIINVVSGSGNIAADFVDVNRNTLQYAGVTASPVLNPVGGVDSLNNAGWFGLTVELSDEADGTLISTAEDAEDNFPTLLVTGISGAATSIDIDINNTAAGTATEGAGQDYTYVGAAQTVTIPAGTYDGTIATDIVMTIEMAALLDATINTDSVAEGNETVVIDIENPGTDVTIGDADGDLATLAVQSWSMQDDDPVLVEFSLATGASTGEVDKDNFPTLFVLGYLAAPATLDLIDGQAGQTANDVNAANSDYLFQVTNSETITIPAGTYDGTTGTAITLNTNYTAVDDILVESGGEIVSFAFANPVGVTVGDADGDATTESTHLYTITDDDANELSGIVYTDEGVTNIGTGKTVTLLVNGVSFGSDDTDATGLYQIAAPVYVAGDVLTLFIDDETENGVLITRGVTTNGGLSGLNIYQDRTIVRTENGTPLTNTDLDTANNADADITALYADGGTTTLATVDGTEFMVWTGDEYAPGGTMDIGTGGLDVNGTLTMITETITLGGDMDLDATATFTAGTSSLILDGTTAQAITTNGDTLGAVTISNTTATVSMADALLASSVTVDATATFDPANFDITTSGDTTMNGTLVAGSGTYDVDGNLTIGAAGVMNLSSGATNVAGNVDNSAGGTITNNTGTLTLDGSGAQSYNNTDPLNDLIVNKAGGGAITLASNVEVAGALTQTLGGFDLATFAANVEGNAVFTAGTIDLGTATSTFAGNWTNNGVTVTPNTSTISLDGTSTQAITSGGQSFTNLTNADATVATTLVDALSVTGTYTNADNAVLQALGNDVTIGTLANGTTGGNDGATIELYGTETVTITAPDVDSGTIEFVGNGTVTIVLVTLPDFGATDYYNLVINDASATKSDIFQLGNALTVANDFTITDGELDSNAQAVDANGDVVIGTAGVWDAGSSAITVAGDWTNTAGITGFEGGTSLVTLDGTGTQVITGDTTFYSLGKTTAGAEALTFAAGSVQTVGGVLALDGTAGTLTIDSATPASTATINVVGGATSFTTATGLDITDSVLNYAGITASPSRSPASSTDLGNNTGWFGVLVELSDAVDGPLASTDETTEDNFPTLLVTGTTAVSLTVEIYDATGGTATAAGTDYTANAAQTITIPAGTYTGTIADDIVMTTEMQALIDLVGDTDVEGDETINIGLQNPSAEVSIGDTDSDTITQTTQFWTITDDDVPLVELSAAAAASTDESGIADNFPVLLVLGTLVSSATVDLADLGTGTATGSGTDYLFNTPKTITIPAGTYDGLVGTAIALTSPTITVDSTVESPSETINFTLQNAVGVAIGDADTSASTQTTHTYTITDDDPGALTYDTGTFIEAAVLDGSIGNSIVITLEGGDTFTVTSGNLTGSGTHYTISNLPAGLTGTETIAIDATGTIATVTIAGSATTHANANDIANVSIVFADAAFTAGPAASITNYSKTDIVLDFGDAAITYSGTGFTETGLNDGSVSGSIIATLSGDTWNAALTATDVTLPTAPAGLTAVLTRDSGTQATLTFTGNATAHANANDVTDMTFTFADAAFTGVTAANTAGATGPASSALGVDFADSAAATPFISYGTGTLSEASANDGSIGNTIVLTLANDTFTVTSGNLTGSGTHYTISNLPAGLTGTETIAIDATGTIATVTIAGSATTHANANDIANVSIVFADAAFTAGSASSVTNYNKSDISLDFDDPTGSGTTLVYDTTALAESGTNDGTITTTATATLTGDTFVVSGGVMTSGTHYSVANVPLGLTAVVTGTSTTTATVALSGTATAHAVANDISDLLVTFLDGAFVGGNAGLVAGAGETFTVSYTDSAGTLTYASSTFTERAANDGGISNTITATLTGDTFSTAGILTGSGTHYTINNLPAAFTEVLTVDAAKTSVLVQLTGTASLHATANDIANLEIVFADAAFTGGNAAGVTGGTKSDLALSYTNPVSPNTITVGATKTGTEAGTVSTEFTAYLDEPAVSTVTFQYDTADGTAIAPADYTAQVAQTGTIAVGASSVVISVPVIDDGDSEGSHAFDLTISDDGNGVTGLGTLGITISAATTTGMIADDETPGADNDTDSLPNAQEDAGYNGGDINGDGTLDSLQPHVGSDSTGLNGIEVTNACQVIGSLVNNTEASNVADDPDHEYPEGFEAYTLTCAAPGHTATIKLYFQTTLTSTEGITLQKYNPNTSMYSNIPNVVLSIETIGVVNVITAIYDVTDGGVLDIDGLANGTIVDPVGLGITSVDFTTASQTVPESAGAITVTASIPAAIGSHITATYALSGTATATGTDYTDTSLLTISIPAGSTTGTATITINDDATTGESTETVILTLSSIVNGAVGTTIPTHTISITENDAAVSSGGSSGGGGGGRSGSSSRPEYVSGSYLRDTVTMEFSKTLDTDSVPDPKDFIVTGTQAYEVIAVGISETSVTLVLDTAITDDQIRVAYTESKNELQGESRGDVNSFSVTIGTPATFTLGAPVQSSVCTERFTTSLQRGDRGASVADMQLFLTAQGYSPGVADGVFGNKTADAIEAFQSTYRAEVLTRIGLGSTTGFWGRSTRVQANTVNCGAGQLVTTQSALQQQVSSICTEPFTVSLRRGSSGQNVASMQQFLADQGFNLGSIDGNFGRATEDAVKGFQVLYRSDVLDRVGISSPTGFFGRSTRQKANEVYCGGVSGAPTLQAPIQSGVDTSRQGLFLKLFDLIRGKQSSTDLETSYNLDALYDVLVDKAAPSFEQPTVETSMNVLAPVVRANASASVSSAFTRTETVVSAPAACDSFSEDLEQEMRGHGDIARLQEFLNAEVDAELPETDYYGPATAAAVRVFQEEYASEILTPHGYSKSTGQVGPATRAKINMLLCQ